MTRLEVDAFGTKYFPVRAGSPGSVGWHDDNYYFGTTRSDTISCVVYLRSSDRRGAATLDQRSAPATSGAHTAIGRPQPSTSGAYRSALRSRPTRAL